MKRSFFLVATAAVAVLPSLPKPPAATVAIEGVVMPFDNITFNGTPVYVDNAIFISRPWSWKDCSDFIEIRVQNEGA